MRTIKYDIELTPNFALSEFIYSSTANKKKFTEQLHPNFIIVENLHHLCSNVLQPLREKIGKIEVNSGYRCKRLNDFLQGAKTSQHLTGCAADIQIRDIKTAVEHIKLMEFDQMIIYPNFIHVSYVPKRLRKQIIYR